MTHPNPDPLHVPEAPVRRSSTTDHISVGPLLAILLVTIAVLVILAASRGGSNPGQLHGAGLIGSVLREAPRVPVTDPPTLGASLRGTATWYDAPSRTDAAAGPALRRALGSGWRGSWVRVSSGGASVAVRLTDWCACGPRNGTPTVIDLDDRAFRVLAPLSRGVIRVAVVPIDAVLPATDTEGGR